MQANEVKTLVVATRNMGKAAEIHELLKGFPIDVKSLDDFGPIPEVEEDGETFEEMPTRRPALRHECSGCRPWPMTPDWS